MKHVYTTILIYAFIYTDSKVEIKFVSEVTSYRGKSYVVAIPADMTQPTLFIVTRQTTTVKIDMPYLQQTDEFTIEGASTVTRIVDTRIALISGNVGSIVHKGIFISCTVPCMVFIAELGIASSDLSFVFPETSLGTEYLVSGYGRNSEKELLLIIATEKDTDLAVVKSGDVKRYSMGRLDVLYRNESSLSGSTITASAPVSIFSGSKCPSISTSYSCDFIFQTLPPTSSYGFLFVLSYMYPRPEYTIGIMALHDYTDITILDSKGTVKESLQLFGKKVSFRTYNFFSGVVTSTKPVSVTQYGHGHGSSDYLGNPSMMLVPAVTNYGTGYEFNAIPGYDSSIGISISSGYEEGLLLNGKRFNPDKQIRIETKSYGTYFILYANITEGYHSLSHTDSDVTFSGWLYGRFVSREYATSLGMVL